MTHHSDRPMTRLEALNDLLRSAGMPRWGKPDLIRARSKKANRTILREIFLLVDIFESDPSRSVSAETAARISLLLGQIHVITESMAAHAARAAAKRAAAKEAP